MKTVLYNQQMIFEKRGPFSHKEGRISFPKDGVLEVKNEAGRFRFPTKDGEVILPKGALRPGENRLCFLTEGRLIPCEGLHLEGKTLTPMGFPMDAVLLALIKEVRCLTRRLGAAEDRLAALEENINGYRLL